MPVVARGTNNADTVSGKLVRSLAGCWTRKLKSNVDPRVLSCMRRILYCETGRFPVP